MVLLPHFVSPPLLSNIIIFANIVSLRCGIVPPPPHIIWFKGRNTYDNLVKIVIIADIHFADIYLPLAA